jgi:hypothetical protein
MAISGKPAAKAIAGKGGKVQNASGKTKAAISRAVKAGYMKVSKTGNVSMTKAGKKAVSDGKL